MSLTVFHAIDDALGRLEYSSLPQHALMEMLVSGFEDTAELRVSSEDFLDVSEWPGVTLDEKGNVVQIDWSNSRLQSPGTLDLRWLPDSVIRLDVSFSKLTVKIDFSALSNTLEDLLLMKTNLSGSFESAILPSSLLLLNVSDNAFRGTIDFASLPTSMKTFVCAQNQFSGTVRFSEIPRAFEDMSLNGNQFSGTLDFDRLPQSMKYLFLNKNEFSGSVNLMNLPRSLEWLRMSSNKFSGTVRIAELPPNLVEIRLYDNRISAVLDADGNKIVDKRIRLSANLDTAE